MFKGRSALTIASMSRSSPAGVALAHAPQSGGDSGVQLLTHKFAGYR
jgi:hypothetical protein